MCQPKRHNIGNMKRNFEFENWAGGAEFRILSLNIISPVFYTNRISYERESNVRDDLVITASLSAV